MIPMETLPGRITKAEVKNGQGSCQVTLLAPLDGIVLDVPLGEIWDWDDAKGEVDIFVRWLEKHQPKVLALVRAIEK